MYLPAGVVVVILTLSFVSRGHWKSPCVKHFCSYSFYFLFLLFLLIHLFLLNLLLLLLLFLLHLILKSRLCMTSPNPIWPFFWLCPRNELWDNKSVQGRGSWRYCLCISCSEAVSYWSRSIESHLPEGSDEATQNVGQDGRCQAEIWTPPSRPQPKQRSASEAPLELKDVGSDHRKAAPITPEATWPPGINLLAQEWFFF